MVFIKRLEMRGFKSFGDKKVSIPLDKGLTVVTGPNGTGKSNICDGIRFTLGDLSARSLRADKMSEVIYDGYSTTSTKTAYVSIQLDNVDRRIPVDTETVTIARRVNSNGESDYFLNGKQAARTQLVDILSMAGLSSNGYNMIMQGTITRLADITPEERRKAIEELVGIAEYDAKKTEARLQLQQAETNLKIAEARLGDVQARLERLEEERNDALRHNFIQLELKKLRATQLSHRIGVQSEGETCLRRDLNQRLQEGENIRKQREALLLEHDQVEAGRRRFDEEVADKGNTRLLEVQRTIGDIMARTATCRIEIESGSAGLKGLAETRNERLQQISDLERRLTEAKQALPRLRDERDELRNLLDEKTSTYQQVSSKLVEMKQSLNTQTKRMRELEDGLGRLSRTVNRLDGNIKSNGTRQRLIADNLKSLQERASTYEETLTNLQNNVSELQTIYEEGEKSLTELAEVVEKNAKRKQGLSTEIVEGEAVTRLAREAVVEFEAQRDVAERFLTEEAALQRIEEMVQEGALLGVIGRLENLITIDSKYRRAVDVASAGWLKALVVENATVALRCIETLKTMRLSPLRLIPLADLEEREEFEPPPIEGIAGPASSFIRCDERFMPAVHFVFGDTIVATSEKAAFLASRAGYRAVDVKGDLYEARGGIVAGFYRAPIELSSLVPSRKAINGLSQSVTTLDKIVGKRRLDVSDLEGELTRLGEERARREQMVSSIGGNVKSVESNIERVRENAKTLEERVARFREDLDKGEEAQVKLRMEMEEQRNLLIKTARERKALRLQTRPDELGKYEVDQTQLNTEINDLQRRSTKIEAELKNLEATLQTRLQPDYETARADIRTIDSQVAMLEEKVSKAEETLKELDGQLSELNKTKEELSASLRSVNDRRREFEVELDRIDAQLRKLEQAYEPLSKEAHRLELEVQARGSEIAHLKEELQGLGYIQPIVVTDEEVREAESTMSVMRSELETLGSVNQLAITQYSEQQEKYKQLSVRRNQLELERKAIIDFMDEIEQKKRNAFMQAFNSINQSFTNYFRKLTAGGEAYFRLQNPEDPFAGGIDIFVQFPGKGTRLLAGASGGEKSVTAVSFVFAIQSLSPAPFYVFDEIDAHLDPHNTERLADVLKEQAAYSQLIVITLRDVIMDRGDRLFGVYIQDGVSRIVSAKIAEAAVPGD